MKVIALLTTALLMSTGAAFAAGCNYGHAKETVAETPLVPLPTAEETADS
ncbi:MAG: hypothetical protein AAFY59_20110 [Pseudomonadota bacterium]